MKTKMMIPVTAALLAFSACGGGSEPETTSEQRDTGSGASGAAEVSIETFNYEPQEIEVSVGEEVSWTNNDDILHTVTAGVQREQAVPGAGDDDVEAEASGEFDGDLDGAGTTFSFTFEKAGEYPYFCEVHVAMTGTVIVTE